MADSIEIMYLNNYHKYENYDIVHVIHGPHIDMGISIVKIVCNLMKHVPLKQCVVCIDNIGLAKIFSIVNDLNIKIIHFHCDLDILRLALLKTKLKARLVQTVHLNRASLCGNLVDKVVCIHRTALDKNIASGISNACVVENTVDIATRDKDMPCPELSFFVCYRVCEYYFSYENFECYSKINAPFHIYGFRDNYEYDNKMLQIVNNYTNIIPHKYTVDVLSVFKKHGCCAFFQPVDKRRPDICFGLSVMEVAKYGLPVVSVRRTQRYQKYVIHGYNGFLADTTEEFIKYCNLLVENKSLYEYFYNNAYNNAARLKNTMPEEYMKIYQELL